MRRLGNYPCQNNLHTLKLQDVIESNIMIQGIANESSCNSFGNNKIHIPANTTKVTNMIKAAATSL